MSNRGVGIVIGTKEATPFEFWFQVHDREIVKVDDIVIVENKKEEGNQTITIKFYGIVVNIIKGFEGVEFHSWNSKTAEGVIPYVLYHLAHVKITRIIPDNYDIPPDPGSEVTLITNQEETNIATNMDKKQNLVPAGILRNGSIAYINWDFISGKNGAHISISGISGIATKTSYALFLIHSILYSQKLKVNKHNLRFIVFSVKGEDLLHIDKRNTEFSAERNLENYYRIMEIELTPFKEEDTNFYLPLKEYNEKTNEFKPYTHERIDNYQSENSNTKIYCWSIEDFLKEELVKYMFDPEDREDDNFIFILNHFSRNLREHARIGNSSKSYFEIRSNNLTFEIDSLYSNQKITLQDLEKKDIKTSLSALLEFVVSYHNIEEGLRELYRIFIPEKAPQQSVNKFIRRFLVSAKEINSLITRNQTKRIEWQEKKVSVVSISDKFLSFRAQRFVVGSLLSEIYYKKQETPYTVFIMIDELNKYAPSTGYSPIKEILLDISERGRSLGIILIGAQQMLSQVDPRIIVNSSIKINGRLDPGEAENKFYNYLPREYKEKSKNISSGTMIIHQPDISVPLVVQFPKPPYATRKEEAELTQNLSLSQYIGINSE
ncbi:MAG: ATP-binding protein [Brevinematales bacterium]|nr:ATP-binding protein [Brevinematales bacterium]